LYSFYFYSQSKLRGFISRKINEVQPVHRALLEFGAAGTARVLERRNDLHDLGAFSARFALMQGLRVCACACGNIDQKQQ
jgi:hypothetical protein